MIVRKATRADIAALADLAERSYRSAFEEILERDALLLERSTDQRKERRELREHDRLVALIDDIAQLRDQQVQLGG